MDKPVLEDELLHIIRRLNPEEQQQVLDFARALPGNNPPRGVMSSSLLRFGGLFPKEDLDEIMKAIEEDCERIDYDGW